MFYVYTEPGSVDEAEFHDWYDHEHGPARLTVPGFRGALRIRRFRLVLSGGPDLPARWAHSPYR